MSCCIDGAGDVWVPPSTYQDHYSEETLKGTCKSSLPDGNLCEKIVCRDKARQAGLEGLFSEACRTQYREGGAKVEPDKDVPAEKKSHCNISDDYRGDYAAKNSLWFGRKGATYNFQPVSQVEMGSHRLSDTFTFRAPPLKAEPAMYRPWTSHSNTTHQDPLKAAEHW
eukprot:CAMPEP_0177587340 /NCGR_PEP_ID=MMETSP0419_2-20121207/5589_1 /TAXON_ID=582737 /ORGANISM="Tetraselmis sp., Strain GSL018" /LENGTH=167 /DNA_ID=CAMNT_0019077363 /DNA_START=76 /DNA_END=576 /DNA_ORIENTATION=-